MELDCTLFEDVHFDCIDDVCDIIKCYIQDSTHKTGVSFDRYGCYSSLSKAKCVIFPKGKTTWEGFQRPFKESHRIVFWCSGDWNMGGWVDEEVIPETIGQYTGLKDKNGKEIYEGDIVKDTNGKVGYVAFLKQEMGFVIVWRNSDSRLGHRNRGGGYELDNSIEVIGNIHNNTELIKEEEK